jgi:hypothetical protein
MSIGSSTASPEEGQVPISDDQCKNDEFQDDVQLKDVTHGHCGRSLYDCQRSNDTESLQTGASRCYAQHCEKLEGHH